MDRLEAEEALGKKEESTSEEGLAFQNEEAEVSIYELEPILERLSAGKATALIVATYLSFGIIWVLLSDKFLATLFPDPQLYVQMQTYKGWLFVLATAILIYSLVYRRMQIILRANREIIDNYEELGLVHEELMAKDHELRNQRETFRQKAFYDEMTGLYNRNSLVQEIDNLLTKAKAGEVEGFTMLLIDIDNFKYINESLGYLMGDEFLKYIADNLKVLVSPPDFLARTGGDEFAIILHGITEKEDILEFVQKIKDSINDTWRVQGFEFHTYFSIGITPCRGLGTCNIEDIYKNTDMALHKAKQEGKNRYVFFTKEIKEGNLAKIEMVSLIKKAIEREEFTLHYQPQFNLETGEIIGVEALIRWSHPVKGNIPPLEFIPLAEETGLIQEIEIFVFKHAIRQVKKWDELGYPAIQMSINLSSKSLMNLGSFARLEKIIDRSTIDKSRLIVEITETAIITDVELATMQLRKLRERGVSIALDDFGTGFSSITYLKDLPIDIVKLDSSYSVCVGNNCSDNFIVKNILQMSHDLGYKVVAEGIEREEQKAQLCEFGCLYGQGYLYSRPLPASEVEKLFLSQGKK